MQREKGSDMMSFLHKSHKILPTNPHPQQECGAMGESSWSIIVVFTYPRAYYCRFLTYYAILCGTYVNSLRSGGN